MTTEELIHTLHKRMVDELHDVLGDDEFHDCLRSKGMHEEADLLAEIASDEYEHALAYKKMILHHGGTISEDDEALLTRAWNVFFSGE